MSAPWRRACPRPRPHPRPRPLARMGCLLSLELLSLLVDVRRYIFTDAVVFSSLSCVCCTDGGKRSARCIIAFCTPGAQQLLHLSMSLSSFLISRSLWYWQIPRSHSQHAARSRAPAGLQHPLDDAANNKNNRPSQHGCLSPADCGLCCLSGSASAISTWKRKEISRAFVLLSSRLSNCS